ncbi:hypothetical protein BGZ68_002678, partial [Mortierella alpina]
LQDVGDAAGPSRKRHAEEGHVDTKATRKRIQTTATKEKGKGKAEVKSKGKERAVN